MNLYDLLFPNLNKGGANKGKSLIDLSNIKDNSTAGIIKNTVLGLPAAGLKVANYAKEFVAPSRGFSEKDIASAKPTFSQVIQGVPKVAAEVVSSIGELSNSVPFGGLVSPLGGPNQNTLIKNLLNTKTGNRLADIGDTIKGYAVPKTAAEAKAMRVTDIASSFLPVGKIKPLTKLNKIEEATQMLLRIERTHPEKKIVNAASAARLALSQAQSPQVAESMIKDFTPAYKLTMMKEAQQLDVASKVIAESKDQKTIETGLRSIGVNNQKLAKELVNVNDPLEVLNKVKEELPYSTRILARSSVEEAAKTPAKTVLQVTDSNGNSVYQAISKADETKFRNLIDTGNMNKAGELQDVTGKSYHLTATPTESLKASGIKEIPGFANFENVKKISETPYTKVIAHERVGTKGVKAHIRTLPAQEAFGAVGGFEVDDNGKLRYSPLKGALGVAGMTAFRRSGAAMKLEELVAEGKIRLKRIGTRDIYEYKKGNIWQRARDEDSAIKAVTPKDKVVKSLPPELEQKKMAIEIQKEALANNPLNSLTKYVSKTGENKGMLPEVLGGKGTSGFKKRGDDMITEALGRNVDSETVRAEMEQFMARKQAVKEAEASLKEEIKAVKLSAEGIPLALTKRQAAILKGERILGKSELRPRSATSPLSSIPAMSGGTGEVRSLERVAEQLASQEIRDPKLRSASSLPKIIEKLPTPVKAKVNILDYLRTPENVLRKIGLQRNADELRRSYEGYLKELPQNIDKITEWSKMVPKESNTKIFRYLDGEAIDLTSKEKEVADEIKGWLVTWADRLDLPKDKRIADYITHLFDDQLIKKEFDEDLAKIIADKVPGSVYDPFLLKRLGGKGYKQDTWAALDAYVKRGTRKFYMDPALGRLEEASKHLEESQWNYVKRFADRINMRPTELDKLIDNSLKQIPFIGYRLGQRPVARLSQMGRQWTYRGMLGLNVGSALRNLSQGINTYARLGEKYTALGYLKLFSKENMAELKASGLLSQALVQDRSISAVKKAMQTADNGLFYMFETAEKINRGAAYFGAKAKGIANGMSEREAIEYAKKVVRDTQFQFGSIDTPVAMSSDIAKTLGQFQTFTTKQIEFLAGMAKRKEYAGLIRYTLAGLAFVYTVGQAFGMKPQDLIPLYRLGVPPSAKLPFEIAKTAVGGEGDITGTLPGYVPAGIQAKKTIQGIKAIQEGGSYDASGKLQFAQGQSPAQKLQAVLFGKYASKNAQDYFNRGEITKEEKAKVQPVYDEVQKLLSEGRQDDALALHNSLSDADKATYKKIKAGATAQKTIDGKKAVLPVYNKVQELLKSGDEAGALALHSGLSDEEKKYYRLVKADQDKIKKAQDGVKPSFDPNETQTEQSVISTVWTYAKAIGVDPVTAFNRIFTGQRIKYVSNGTVVVYRMPLAESQAEKKAQGSVGAEVKLDHTIPLQLGGSNSKDNLKLVPTAVWQSYTQVENEIGKALRDGKITKAVAQTLIRDFKEGKLTGEDVYNSIGN